MLRFGVGGAFAGPETLNCELLITQLPHEEAFDMEAVIARFLP